MAKALGSSRTKSRETLYAQIDELYTDAFSDGITVAGSSATSTVNAGNSIALKDSTGAIVGYLAVYAVAALTS